MRPKTFKFEKYNFNPKTGVMKMCYSTGDFKFTEKLFFFKPIKKLELQKQKALDKALFNLFLIAGISYYKTFASKKILLDKKYKLNREQAAFWNKVYTKGLGEFFYKNKKIGRASCRERV